MHLSIILISHHIKDAISSLKTWLSSSLNYRTSILRPSIRLFKTTKKSEPKVHQILFQIELIWPIIWVRYRLNHMKLTISYDTKIEEVPFKYNNAKHLIPDLGESWFICSDKTATSYEECICLEELENMLTTTAIKIEDTPVGKKFKTAKRSRLYNVARPVVVGAFLW